MMGHVLSAVAPVLIVAALGFFWVRSERPLENTTLTPLIVEIGTPCLILATFLRAGISPSAFATMAAASLMALVCFAATAYLMLRLLDLRVRTFLPSLTFPNNGNLGLPLAAYAFGSEGLGYAIVFYAICMVGQFTVGQAVAAGQANWRGILRMPLIYATIIGAVLSFTGIAPPAWVVDTIALIGGMTIPLMLLMLGASLARLHVQSVSRAALLAGVRILPGAAIGYVVALLFGLHGTAQAVLIMQCAMPVAVYNYLFAQKWNNQPEEVAGLVVASTLASIASVPALLWLLSP
jgi:hypothetical protein